MHSPQNRRNSAVFPTPASPLTSMTRPRDLRRAASRPSPSAETSALRSSSSFDVPQTPVGVTCRTRPDCPRTLRPIQPFPRLAHCSPRRRPPGRRSFSLGRRHRSRHHSLISAAHAPRRGCPTLCGVALRHSRRPRRAAALDRRGAASTWDWRCSSRVARIWRWRSTTGSGRLRAEQAIPAATSLIRVELVDHQRGDRPTPSGPSRDRRIRAASGRRESAVSSA